MGLSLELSLEGAATFPSWAAAGIVSIDDLGLRMGPAHGPTGPIQEAHWLGMDVNLLVLVCRHAHNKGWSMRSLHKIDPSWYP